MRFSVTKLYSPAASSENTSIDKTSISEGVKLMVGTRFRTNKRGEKKKTLLFITNKTNKVRILTPENIFFKATHKQKTRNYPPLYAGKPQILSFHSHKINHTKMVNRPRERRRSRTGEGERTPLTPHRCLNGKLKPISCYRASYTAFLFSVLYQNSC